MFKNWIGCSSSNFRSGRSGFQPQAIVIHGNGGSLAAIDQRCASPNAYNAPHYAVGASGEIHQYVEEKDTAFQAGVVVNPTWKSIQAGKNPNLYTIGIELEKPASGQLPDAQYQTLAALIVDIGQRWTIALDAGHIVLHDEIRAGVNCPGAGFDRSKLLNLFAPSRTVPAVPPQANQTDTGVPSIDSLFNRPEAPAICETADPAAIGMVQDLLTGHGLPGLPTVLSSNYGVWGPKTASAVQEFQRNSDLAATGQVDKSALQKMIDQPAVDPRASRAYLTLVLHCPFTSLHKILSLVAQMEGAGKFAAVNRNTDRAGMSFGLIQWAQKPGRLAELLTAFSSAGREQFIAIFAAGDSALADALLAHLRQPFSGVDPKTGNTTDSAFDLIEEPWLTRFRQAAVLPHFQQVQVSLALDAFGKSCSRIRQYAPDLISERAIGFMLDVANQFGDAGAQKLYNHAHQNGMRQLDLLEAIANESVAAMDDSLKAGVRARRDRFLETHLLSDTQPYGA